MGNPTTIVAPYAGMILVTNLYIYLIINIDADSIKLRYKKKSEIEGELSEEQNEEFLMTFNKVYTLLLIFVELRFYLRITQILW